MKKELIDERFSLFVENDIRYLRNILGGGWN